MVKKFNKLRSDFPILQQMVNQYPLCYLDNASTTQKPQQVLDAVMNFYCTNNANIYRSAHSVPSLKILNHDVQCSHGSGVGQFDKEQLFYAQARGLEKEVAKKLLLEGFLSDLFRGFDAKILKNIGTSLKNKLLG